MKIRVRVKPGAKRAELTQEVGGGWRAKVKAKPEKGKANDDLVALVAKSFGVKKGQVVITQGRKSREKIVEIHE
jgi:uncharacterized protein (TIGR00251 family)